MVDVMSGFAARPATLNWFWMMPETCSTAFAGSTIVSAPLPGAQPVVIFGPFRLAGLIARAASKLAAKMASCSEQSPSVSTSWLTVVTVMIAPSACGAAGAAGWATAKAGSRAATAWATLPGAAASAVGGAPRVNAKVGTSAPIASAVTTLAATRARRRPVAAMRAVEREKGLLEGRMAISFWPCVHQDRTNAARGVQSVGTQKPHPSRSGYGNRNA